MTGLALFQLAIPDDWQAAVVRDGPYMISTRGLTLETAGFIHLSFRHQVPVVAARFYADVQDLLVLTIESDALVGASLEVRVENLEGGAEPFPHLYGPLPLYAVVGVQVLGDWLEAGGRS